MKNPISVRIEYENGRSNPQEILRCGIDAINAISLFDETLGRCVSASIKNALKLEKFEEGSLIIKMASLFVESSDEKHIDERITPENTAKFVENARERIVKRIESFPDIIPGKSITELVSDVTIAAQELGIHDSVGYTPPNPIELGKAVNSLLDCGSSLKPGEKVQFSSAENPEINKDYIDIPQGKKVDIDDVIESLVGRELENTTDQILAIRKPDFLGDSQWDFKRGKDSISAKIEDEEWMQRFKNGEIVIVPNDALHVDLHEHAKYDKNGVMIFMKRTILKVKEVIKGSQNG